jgi:flagellar hook assembly protein FlgD
LLFWDTRVSPAKIYFKKGTISKDEENTHLELAISPNPFHNKTVIEFRVKSSELKDLQLQIYDLSGRVVKTFNSINPINSIVWDGKSDDGTLLNSGIYFIKVVGQGFSLANPPRKVVFIR